MGRNIFNQTPEAAKDTKAASPAPAKRAMLAGSVGGLRDSLREITANSIRDIAPDQIELDGLQDRLVLEDSSIEELAESIRKHGQQVPILVRPSDQPDRYRIIYGRRRLAAVRKIGGTIKAIVRPLDDEASLIAQGQENNLRLDPSFIEKALFIREMENAGYKSSVIQDALGLSRQGLSNHRVITGQLPMDLVYLIGPAHGIGRRQWAYLADLADQVPLLDVARSTLASLPGHTASPEKFQAVYAAVQQYTRDSSSKAERSNQATVVKDASGARLGTLAIDGRSVAIKILRKDNPDFGQWIEENAEVMLRKLFDQWQNESGPGS